MKNSPKPNSEQLHELVGLTARLSAIVSLVKNSESREQFTFSELDRDFKKALSDLEKIWDQAFK